MPKGQSITAIEAELNACNAREALIRKKWAPLDEKIKRCWEDRRAIAKRLSEARVAQMTDTPDWAVLIKCNSNNGGMTLYERGKQEFQKIGLSMSGIWPDTLDVALSVQLTRDDPASFDKTMAAIATIAPFMTPRDNGKIGFGIFEKTLSEYGIYDLIVQYDLSEAILQKTTYSRTLELKRGPLADIIRYVQQNHWYNRLDD